MLSDDDIMRQVLAAFQEEQAEHCQAIGSLLLDLERDPQHPQTDELITRLFREAHSLKGGARAAGLEAVEELAHRIEDVFSAVRQGSLTITADLCDPIYSALDAIGEQMAKVAAGQAVSVDAYQPLLEQLGALTAPESQPDDPPPSAEEAAAQAETPANAPDVSEKQTIVRKERRKGRGRRAEDKQLPASTEPQESPSASDEGSSAPRSAPGEDVHWEMTSSTVRLSTSVLDELMNETGELIISAARTQQQSRDARTLADLPASWRRVWRQINPIITRIKDEQMELSPTVHHLQNRTPETAAVRSPQQGPGLAVQHDVILLVDALTQANQLVTTLEQRLKDHARQTADGAAGLSAVTGRMQSQIRRTRMLSLATLFNPLRMQIREMARAANKQVVLETDDGGAEADRQVLEGLREVLLHLLRNAVDHGIEPAAVRSTQSKAAEGRVSLRATVSGDYLALSVTDDGAGLDIGAICHKAIDRGLISEADLARLSEEDIIELIFLPGFSTREAVDRLSGRGVGLDIVRSTVERMHGSVTVQSTPGAGCHFAIRVPLSLTSSHGLLLRIGKATYMLPLESIQRIVPVAPQDIKVIEGHAALTIDDHPITLVHLAHLLSEERDARSYEQRNGKSNGGAAERSLALLLGSGERRIACLIDAVLGEQELVVHRLPAPLQRVQFIAGATILPDGQVVPILDLVDVLRAAIGVRGTIQVSQAPIVAQHKPTSVVVDDSITTRTLEKNILEAAGYYVHLATDGVEALHTLHRLTENGGCDLLLSDIDMPNLNGFDLTTQVRSDPQLKHLPIVLVTSLDKASDREQGLSAGADAYIVKRAFDQQVLLDTIARLI